MMVSTLFRASHYCLTLVFVLFLATSLLGQTQIVQQQQLQSSVSRLDCGTVNIGETAPVTSYQLTARNLTDTITVLAPACVEVRSGNSPWQQSVRIAPLTQGTDSVAVFVRLANSLPMLVQSGIRHFVGLAEANIRLDVLGIVREKPVQSSAGTLEFAGHGLPTRIGSLYSLDSLLIAEQPESYPPFPSYNTSIDKGETWVRGTLTGTRISTLFKAPGSVAAPHNNSLYAFTVISDSAKLQRSDDNGITWSVLNYHIPFRSYIELWIQGTTWLVREPAVHKLYRSTDNGATWQRVDDTVFAEKFLSGSFVNWRGSILMIGFDKGGENLFLFRSSDTGKTWKMQTSRPKLLQWRTQVLSNGSVCLVVTDSAMYKLRDDGGALESFKLPDGFRHISVSGDQFLVWNGVNGKANRSTNATFWLETRTTKVSNDLEKITFVGTAVYARMFIDGRSTNTVLLRSMDGGATFHLGLSGIYSPTTIREWLKQDDNVLSWVEYYPPFRLLPTSSFWEEYFPNDLSYKISSKHQIVLDTVTLSKNSSSTGVIRRSSSGNAHVITQGFAPNTSIYLLYHANGVVYASSRNSIYHSLDSGLTWHIASTGLLPGAAIIDFTNIGTTMFASDIDRGLYRSSNNGEKWELVGTPVKNVPPYVIWKNFEGVKGLLSSATRLFISTESGVYQSRDYGSTWSSLYANTDLRGSYIFLAGYRSPYLFMTTPSGFNRLKIPSQPEFLLQPQTLRFRIAPNNPSKPVQTIRLINLGTGAGEIRAITISQPEDFELLSSPPARIEAGDTASLTVRFRSKRPGTTRAAITFTVAEPGGSVEIPLVCSITSEVSADAPFDSTQTGTSSPLTVGAVLPFPATDEATLYYTLESPTDITIDLIDMRGAVTARLVNSVQGAGTHRVSISTRLLANGLYALVFRSGFGVVQRWLMVARQ
jgi:photosystem II stability/assembly factor-like uncharacterized protein